jgi:hypothetical protein
MDLPDFMQAFRQRASCHPASDIDTRMGPREEERQSRFFSEARHVLCLPIFDCLHRRDAVVSYLAGYCHSQPAFR